MEKTFAQLVFGELPFYPQWAALFVFFAIGATFYQYRRITAAIKANKDTPNEFKLSHYLKDPQNHFQFLVMAACGFVVIRFGSEYIGIKSVTENIEGLCFTALILGTGGQYLITLVTNGLDFAFKKIEKIIRNVSKNT